METREKSIVIEPIKETRMKVQLIGDSDLILHKKSREWERREVWKQNNVKGAEPPASHKIKIPVWEQLITSVTWEKPINFHDDNVELYTEEELKEYLANNRPCILSVAFYNSFAEAFRTFFKDSIKKNGTDLQRAINMGRTVFPVDFEIANVEQKLVPNTGITKTNVVCNQLVFSNWKCDIDISCADIVFPYKTVLSIIQTTGTYIGVGTNRKYGYGRYHIGNIEII